MERVLIVAKTRMHGAVCVSGLTRDTTSSIRLLRPDRSNQPINTSFDVGQVWELEFHQIPLNTLVRISLARWWVPAGMSEERCYLQLSGWYL